MWVVTHVSDHEGAVLKCFASLFRNEAIFISTVTLTMHIFCKNSQREYQRNLLRMSILFSLLCCAFYEAGVWHFCRKIELVPYQASRMIDAYVVFKERCRNN